MKKKKIGLPWWLSGKEFACNAGDVCLIPGSERSPVEGNDNPLQYTVFLPGKSHGQGSPMGYSPWGCKRVGHNLATKQQQIFRYSVQFSSITQSCPTPSLQPHESQHARPPCSSPTPRVHPDSCALSRWCHPAISSSVVPFSSCPQFLPASESFPMSQLFA